MTTVDWARSDEFGVLCDLVSSDHLVCLTGAGISRGMRRKYPEPGQDQLPGWVALLRELLAEFAADMSAADAESARRLLDPEDERPAARAVADVVKNLPSATQRSGAEAALGALGPFIGSRELILAASLIRQANPSAFDARFRRAITEEPGQTSPAHTALLDLYPRGILTFNYDGGHEAACGAADRDYRLLNPVAIDSEEAFRQMLERRLQDFFILKAHGSVDSTEPLVLASDEYRRLLAKSPSFRAFVQNLFTNFSFLMVGYGLDDPDFDLFLRTMAEQFAGPLQRHIVVRPVHERGRHEEVERLTYGIHTLHLNGFDEIPEALKLAARTAGPGLQRTLRDCLSAQHEDRRRGHDALGELGPAGRKVAGEVLTGHLASTNTFEVSEAAYSLGVLDPHAHKKRLVELVNQHNDSAVLGRTLTVLRSSLEPADLPLLADWAKRFRDTPPTGSRTDRIVKYLDYLIVYVDHKFQSDPPAHSGHPPTA